MSLDFPEKSLYSSLHFVGHTLAVLTCPKTVLNLFSVVVKIIKSWAQNYSTNAVCINNYREKFSILLFNPYGRALCCDVIATMLLPNNARVMSSFIIQATRFYALL